MKAVGAESPLPDASGLWLRLSEDQRLKRDEYRRFSDERIVPNAEAWDRAGEMPREAIDELIAAGYLGSLLPGGGGPGLDPLLYGLLTEEIGRGCSSLRSLMTVHDMVCVALARWGSAELRREFLPLLASCEVLGALAISEPDIGSDAAGVTLEARRERGDYVLDGTKRWITFGRVADVVLTLARAEDGKLTAFLVDTKSTGLTRQPLQVSGTRAAMLAELRFEACRVRADRVVGRTGFGLSHVMATALDHGRYSVAWGSVGIAQACLNASISHASTRRQFGKRLDEHQLVRRLLTEMIAQSQAARLLCCRAGTLRQDGDAGAIPETQLAKYFASRAAVSAANDAIQIHGAWGISEDMPLSRFLRDAKVMEIIEGSSQIIQNTLPQYPLPEL